MGKDLEETLNDRSFWHFRYKQQAAWTRETRRFLFSQTGVQSEDHILDVGCGSGAVLEALAADGYTHLTGLDIDISILSPTKSKPFLTTCADGIAAPFPDNTFDHALCHFTLMWVNNPFRIVREMRRMVTPGGWVFALAEPDYGGRISYPATLENLAGLQTSALQQQGANIHMGRELLAILSDCGLQYINGGIIGAEMSGDAANALRGDLRVLRKDLADYLTPQDSARRLEGAETAASKPGAVWYVPVCYAYGQAA